MAYYLVRAKAYNIDDLRSRLDSGEIRAMRPFGQAMELGLNGARVDGDWVVWEEEDYCTPPLAMERRAVLDDYFTELSVQKVGQGAGWDQIEHLPSIWENNPS